VATYRVVLADDHLLFREGMKLLIERMPDVEVVGEAGDGLELLLTSPCPISGELRRLVRSR
jgi:DNA-binding NarL/FixJ family response regulator